MRRQERTRMYERGQECRIYRENIRRWSLFLTLAILACKLLSYQNNVHYRTFFIPAFRPHLMKSVRLREITVTGCVPCPEKYQSRLIPRMKSFIVWAIFFSRVNLLFIRAISTRAISAIYPLPGFDASLNSKRNRFRLE
jgi:hypothetical protein